MTWIWLPSSDSKNGKGFWVRTESVCRVVPFQYQESLGDVVESRDHARINFAGGVDCAYVGMSAPDLVNLLEKAEHPESPSDDE